jgi:hypothetical protein
MAASPSGRVSPTDDNSDRSFFETVVVRAAQRSAPAGASASALRGAGARRTRVRAIAQRHQRRISMNATKSTFKSALSLGLLVVGTLFAAAPAGAVTVSGYTGQANVNDSRCMDKWAAQVDNQCSGAITVHFDVPTTASPDHYYAHVWGPYPQTISCWAESWNYDQTYRSYNNPVGNGVAGASTLDLGQIGTLNTHDVVCTMQSGAAVHAIDG